MSKYTKSEKINYVNQFLKEYQQDNKLSCAQFSRRVFGLNGHSYFIKWIRKYDTDHIFPLKRRSGKETMQSKLITPAQSSTAGGEIVAIGKAIIHKPSVPIEVAPIKIDIPGMTITLDAQSDINQLKRVIIAIKEAN
jgi:hypothetical protein